MDIVEILRQLQTQPIRSVNGPLGAIHILEAADAAMRDQWMEELVRIEADAGVCAVVLGHEFEPGEQLQLVTREELERTLAESRASLVELDQWVSEPAPQSSPNYGAAVVTWMKTHAEGAPLQSLMDAIAQAPVEEWSRIPPWKPPEDEPANDGYVDASARGVALIEAGAGHQVLAMFAFGHFNACPQTVEHVARAMRWERDHGAKLRYLAADAYAFAVARPPQSESELQRLLEEQAHLYADERPPPGALRQLRRWFFWWD
jgi:hypothetical protein